MDSQAIKRAIRKFNKRINKRGGNVPYFENKSGGVPYFENKSGGIYKKNKKFKIKSKLQKIENRRNNKLHY